MKSNKTFIPNTHIFKYIDEEYLKKRVLHDALWRGLWDLPPVNSIDNLLYKILTNENIFSHIPLKRPITAMRFVPLTNTSDKTSFCIVKNNLTDKYSDYTRNDISVQLGTLKNIDFFNIYSNLGIKYYYSSNYVKEFNEIVANYLPDNCVIGYKGNLRRLRRENGNFCEPEALKNKSEVHDADFLICYIKNEHIQDIIKPLPPLASAHIPLKELLHFDTNRAQLPPLADIISQDPMLGLWDAWWNEDNEPDYKYYYPVSLETPSVASDPWQAIQEDASVCIDFGTSSTVAAVRENEDEKIRLLRLSGGFEAEIKAKDLENPTAIEILDYNAFMDIWQKTPWRPFVSWSDMKFSHVASDEMRHGINSLKGLRNIKTWVRNMPGQKPFLFTDAKSTQFSLTPLPVEEGEEGIGNIERPLDPVEVYAFYLGLMLNNQVAFGGRIYCDYTLTFPVKFTDDTKKRILQAFRRGLLRSLPLSLVSSKRFSQNCPFRLRQLASEPVAFAAAALPYLKIEADEGGAAFAVFDFGGGTTDFAYGLFRKALPEEEENQGWEKVVDILDTYGDETLGGEHLVDMLAYEVLKINAPVFQKAGITFICPAGFSPFEGSELLFSESRPGRANFNTLREALRPVWEEGQLGDEDTGTLAANFISLDSSEKSVNFSVSMGNDSDWLKNLLRKRIGEGVAKFFAAFRHAFNSHNIFPQKLHILLAGNSCKSPLTAEALENHIRTITPTEKDSILIHYEMIETQAEASSIVPTLKTGVALGLVQLQPGGKIGHVSRYIQKEASFPFTVGYFRNDILIKVLEHDQTYGEWQPIGKVFQHGVQVLGYTDNAESREGKFPRELCKVIRVNWGTENAGKNIYIKAVDPSTVCLALGDCEKPRGDTIKQLTLKH